MEENKRILKLSKSKAWAILKEISESIFDEKVHWFYDKSHKDDIGKTTYDYNTDEIVVYLNPVQFNFKRVYNFGQCNDVDFLNMISAIYHEKEHCLQYMKIYHSAELSDERKAFIIDCLANLNNPQLYKDCYYINSMEINAEYVAIQKTYNYLFSEFKEYSSSELNSIYLSFMNSKISENKDYWIKPLNGKYFESIEEIEFLFREKIKNIKEYDLNDYLRHDYRCADECYQFLYMHQDWRYEFINRTTETSEKYKMISSLMASLHQKEASKIPGFNDLHLSVKENWGLELTEYMRSEFFEAFSPAFS